MRSSLFNSFAIALIYALTGWLSIQVAVPPGYAAPVFPPAGIALSAMLIFGIGIWPGVFAGSLAVQFLASLQAGAETFSPALLAAPVGACVQALVGTLLARRLVGFPNALDKPSSVLRFLGLVAPLSCLINASVALPALMRAGIIPPGEALFNWWNWWLGDTLGVMLAAPLMFVFFAEPREIWRPRRTVVALPLLAAILLTGLAFHQLRANETMRIRTQFARDAEDLANLVRTRLEARIDAILSIERFVVLAGDPDREAFRAFVTPILQRHPGVRNFSWNPLVRSDRRSRFEARIRDEGYADFVITDRTSGSRAGTLPAREAAEYLPILFVEPLEDNRTVLGLNPLSTPEALEAIESTRRTGRPAASAGFRLVQETGNQRGVVVYLAAFAEGLGGLSERFLGVVSGAFRMDDALETTRSALAGRNIEMCLVDRDTTPDNLRLSGPLGCESPEWSAVEMATTVPLPFAGRQWEIRLRGNSGFARGLTSWAAWASIAIGLSAATILGAFLLVTTGHTRRIARLVAERTSQLAVAGARMLEQQVALARAQRIARLGSWEFDAASGTLNCSDELRALLGLEAAGKLDLGQLAAAVDPRDRDALSNAIGELMREPGRVEIDCRVDVDRTRTVHFRIESEWHDERLFRLRGTVQDVTAAREAEAHIQHLAHYDVLTGLPNRNLWMDRAQSALHSAQRHGDVLAVLFLDLDHFKTVNDSLGHPAGDRLLGAIAQHLAGCMREEDVLARLGGDEFVVLLPRLPRADDAAIVARKMLAVLAEPIEIDGHQLTLSVSIGIALYPVDGGDVDTLLKHADTAMYGAKDAGRNNFQFFVPEMNVRAFERLMLENGLRRAIERNELVLHYQPQIDVETGRIVGAEALVRWNHPEMGLVLPNQFIPVAEDSGLIGPLGVWALNAACRQQVRWRESGLTDLLVAINISALQFRKTDFVETVSEILAATGADPRCIELEITESALMQPSDDLFERLDRLVAMGLTLALDDFGTGYSSLAYLKRLPIHRLKLDRSFVIDLPGDPEDAAIATATLSLARDLGMGVVAEGVESAAQRDFLAVRGCRVMQGYLFARPLDVADFDRWITARAG